MVPDGAVATIGPSHFDRVKDVIVLKDVPAEEEERVILLNGQMNVQGTLGTFDAVDI